MVPGITAAASVAVDGFDSFARLADGHVVTWGRHEPVHDLGIAPAAGFVDGDGVECALRDHTATCVVFGVEPTKATIANVTQVVAGSMTACALLADRTVACTGVNNHGQVGDGTTIDHDAFVRVPGVADAVQLAIGDYHACARLGDGTITCWGGCVDDLGVDLQAKLAAEMAWVRRLARALVKDDAAADDVAQDTWLVAAR